METRKLYYEDCHRRQFSARVLSCEKTDRGFAVVLDQTAFYPEGGGQACDTGTLGSARVLDTRERGEEIVHLCDGPLAVGNAVEGTIDWERRFDQMQQHAGEHILSGLIYEAFGYQNVGFHVGEQCMEVDFDGPLTGEQIRALEIKANRAVWENLPIRCWYPSPRELPQVGYRTKRALPWPVRIVEIPGYDKCACCGVHVGQTGEIGLIKILSAAKFHQGTRLQMLCGGRALAYMTRLHDQARAVSAAFSAKILEIGDAAQRMNEALTQEKLRANLLQTRVLAQIAAGYRGAGKAVHFEENLTPGALRELAEAMAREAGCLAAALTGAEGGCQICLCGDPGQVKDLGSAMSKALNGRGGGKPGYFQGSLRAEKDQILAWLRAQLT